ncbi:MAG: secondary thiamine-phosphate synthase enzyme YjbQ [Desulfobacteraceae bacterium]|jgi:secondary thiamine-phosphate synthase enzyme
MGHLKMHCETIDISLEKGPDICDISPLLVNGIQASGIGNGCLNATMVGSTGSLTTIEHEPGVVEDLKKAMERMAPPDITYAHELAWHDGNGHSHVQAALMGPSISLPIRQGRLRLGTWQQVVAINHDNRSRRRSIEVTIIGV